MRVTKDSIRTLVGLKRLPRRFRMYVAGCWLYDVLKANKINKHLWSQTYWVVLRSLDTKRMAITWRAGDKDAEPKGHLYNPAWDRKGT